MATSTPQDLIETACAFCDLAVRETERDRGSLEKAAQYAAIAQAHAVTAQAMMLAQVVTQLTNGDWVVNTYDCSRPL